MKLPPPRIAERKTKAQIEAMLNFCADLTDPRPRTQEETMELLTRARKLGIELPPQTIQGNTL